jgi:KaiC/GvpD/RAD55 family RecA-like ATPase
LVLSQDVQLEADSTLQLELPLYDWDPAIRYEIIGIPVVGAKVDLYLNETLAGSSTCDGNGVAHFTSVPTGSYDVVVNALFISKRFFNVTHTTTPSGTNLEVPVVSRVPQSTIVTLAVLAIVVFYGLFSIVRRRVHRVQTRHISELMGGAVPRPAVIMIVGPSGSGKSLLMQNVLTHSLMLGRPCVYVSNAELPSKIREQLSKIGANPRKCEDENRLRFIDAYSGESGAASPEKHAVSSPRDLTALGIQITSCSEELGGNADVYLDSLTPIVAAGGRARGFDFVQYYSARTTKAGGTFLYATTPMMDPQLLSRFEEASDCVLELKKASGPGKVRGALLVKKARGLEHEPDWVDFRITSKGRMEFLQRRDEKA